MGCITSGNKRNGKLTFHFVGIKQTKSSQSTVNIRHKVPITTIHSSLKTNDTISSLKKLIHKTYKIPSDSDILVLYSHTIISQNNDLTLQSFDITDNSLLFIAIKTENNFDLSSLSLQDASSVENEELVSPRLNQLHAFRNNHFHHRRNTTLTFENLNVHNHFRPRPRLHINPTNIVLDDANDDEKETTQIRNPFEDDLELSDDSDILIYDAQHEHVFTLNPITIDTEVKMDETPALPSVPARSRIPLSFRYETTPSFSPIPEPPPRRISALRRINTRDTLSAPVDRTPLSPRLRPMPTLNITQRIENNIQIREDSPSTSVSSTNSAVLPRFNLRLEFETETIRGSIIDAQNIITLNRVNSQSNSNDVSLDSTITANEPNYFKESTETKKGLSLTPIKGFDVITQERDVLGYTMPVCGHFMNKDSLYEYALNVFNDRNNICLECPHSLDSKEHKSDEWACVQCTFLNKMSRNSCEMCLGAKPERKTICGEKWEYALVKKVLLIHTHSEAVNIGMEQDIIDKLVELELLSARNTIERECNAQKCPECETLYVRENDNGKVWGHKGSQSNLEKICKTECVMCKNDVSFCFGCGERWGNDHFCDSSFREELIQILTGAEMKKIGEVKDVPSIRCCPNCCQLIYHSEACKHMKCKGCKTDFCFVCLKEKKNGNWQCGSHSTVCPAAEKQNVKTLPDSIVINKKAFTVF